MIDPAYLVGAGGLVTAIGLAVAAFRKSGPESSQILIDAAKGVVLIQKDTIQDLKNDVAELTGRVDSLEDRLRQTTYERDRLAAENERLRGRVAGLEKRVHELEAHEAG